MVLDLIVDDGVPSRGASKNLTFRSMLERFRLQNQAVGAYFVGFSAVFMLRRPPEGRLGPTLCCGGRGLWCARHLRPHGGLGVRPGLGAHGGGGAAARGHGAGDAQQGGDGEGEGEAGDGLESGCVFHVRREHQRWQGAIFDHFSGFSACIGPVSRWWTWRNWVESSMRAASNAPLALSPWWAALSRRKPPKHTVPWLTKGIQWLARGTKCFYEKFGEVCKVLFGRF